jgi:ribonucleoside-diphosphate reductase alpha chain
VALLRLGRGAWVPLPWTERARFPVVAPGWRALLLTNQKTKTKRGIAMTIVLPTSELYLKEYSYFDRLHAEKYRDTDQTKENHDLRLSTNLSSDPVHAQHLKQSLERHRFLPAGRIQAAFGASEREVSPFNCSVSQTIHDDMGSIMDAVSKAAMILRLGTGIGYNFSNLRPEGSEIKKLKTKSSGPLSFMKIFDVMASTIASSGHRRGAQMGIMNVDHPDIEDFIDAKMVKGAYRQFNLSVGVTDKFMEAVDNNADWPLVHNGHVYKTIRANLLWEKITKNAYYSAEPGIIFIDRLNQENNLYYCEEIEATNPCAEQPLPPNGLCTLGSFNLMGYLYKSQETGTYKFDFDTFKQDINNWVEAYDNIFDRAIYAIPEHESDATAKRRMGLGLTGIANALEYILYKPSYGSMEFCSNLNVIAHTLMEQAYWKSIDLARTRGSFMLYDREKYMSGKFICKLPPKILEAMAKHGIRNSHLISYAPCGTISQTAGNISSGVEPIFYHEVSRDVFMKDGFENITIKDFNYRTFGFKGKTLEECSVEDHLRVAETCQRYCDSAVSKTVNVAKSCTYEDYAQIYVQAHKLGLKGITVYRPSELRGAVITEAKNEADQIPKVEPITMPSNCASGACSL